jgi:hypothetical protein
MAEKVIMAFREVCGFDTAREKKKTRINVFRHCQTEDV